MTTNNIDNNNSQQGRFVATIALVLGALGLPNGNILSRAATSELMTIGDVVTNNKQSPMQAH